MTETSTAGSPASATSTPSTRPSAQQQRLNSAAAAAAAANAPKDRACPYCHVNFTSSSLGRHLDLYIKDKNPKPPDGVHNVEEIRKSRAGITRRQAKSSKKQRQNDRTQSSAPNGSLADSASPTNSQVDRRMGPYAYRNIFNTPHWTSTGVITDSDANQQLLNGDSTMAVESPGPPTLDPVVRRKWIEERERGRAAELALEELIDSIKAASSQPKVPEAFDFDFFACSFPELCLHILSPPATLERPTFIPDPLSWPMDPPGESAYHALQRKVLEILTQWRETYHPPNPRKRQRSGSPERSECADSLEPNPLFQHHLTTAWNQWSQLPMMRKGPDWHVCCMRAFARELQKHAETKKRLEYLETELNRSKIVNARLTECQMPREWLHTPASQLPLAKLAADKVDRQLQKSGLDAETLIAKWRPRVQAAKATGKQSHERQKNLAAIGPVSNVDEASKRPAMHDLSYDGRIPSDEDDDDDDDEYDEDQGEDEEDEMAAGPPKGSIAPSLRKQLGAFAST